MKQEICKLVEQEKVIAIVRGVDPDTCLKVAEALYAGGIRLLEVTFPQKTPELHQKTADTIAVLKQAFEGRMRIGAGTVVTVEQVDMAAKAGAEYIISPNVDTDVIRRTLELGLVSMPGALTPSEVMIAHKAGADYVKLFPIGLMGVDYVKAIMAPISHVKMLAVGNISSDNAADYIKAGVLGVGVGGKLVNKNAIAAGDFESLTNAARELIAAVNNV